MTVKRVVAKVGVAGAMGLTGLGLSMGLSSGIAQAQPGFVPMYHWCPGDDWHPEWGNNWDWGVCHDDHHRDMDGYDHSRDWWGGPAPWQPWWQH